MNMEAQMFVIGWDSVMQYN